MEAALSFLNIFLQVQAPSYSQDLQVVVIILQLMIALSIINIWVLQYKNMSDQFSEFRLPSWSKNVIGLVKGLLCVILIAGIWWYQMAIIGAIGIAIFTFFAILVHLRAKHPLSKIIPAIIICVVSIVVAVLYNRYKFKG